MPETLIVNIADRICDIYEWFLETKEYSTNTRAGWIIRSAQDRLLDTTDKNTPKIRKKLEKQPILGTVKFTLPASLNRKARDVEQTVRTESKVLKLDDQVLSGIRSDFAVPCFVNHIKRLFLLNKIINLFFQIFLKTDYKSVC